MLEVDERESGEDYKVSSDADVADAKGDHEQDVDGSSCRDGAAVIGRAEVQAVAVHQPDEKHSVEAKESDQIKGSAIELGNHFDELELASCGYEREEELEPEPNWNTAVGVLVISEL